MSVLDISTLAVHTTPPPADIADKQLNEVSQRVAVGVYQPEPLTKKYVFNADGDGGERVRVVEKLNKILNFNTPELLNIRSLAEKNEAVDQRREVEIKKGFRGTQIYNEALRYGAQIALSSTINDFVKGIQKRQGELRNIYNFGALMLYRGTVVPPVVSVSRDVVNTDGNTYQRIAAHYKIVSQAKFVSSPLTFLDYFNFQNYDVDSPSQYDVPMTQNEMNYWRNGVYDGWLAGSSQASMEIESAINRLNRDYIGMVRYKIMLLSNMVSEPVVSENNRGTDTSKTSMDVGKVSLNLSNDMRFNANDELWEVLPMLDKLELTNLVSPEQKVE
ncbi:type IV secretory system conjugative DNA transfer family protein [Photobacterium damselae]|uniref:type IV secretory system conjugative DNA transfer family protein n=1 Tax=Photobacterium damselae TaxID=38293 RepID=UPI001F2C1B6A|nr:type IV secretory system conjugative DNA transfer family protein [Photobacterium damselae]UKA04698.1 type IV secretion system DotC family protein [Photobacterium damselae subsp. damselae]